MLLDRCLILLLNNRLVLILDRRLALLLDRRLIPVAIWNQPLLSWMNTVSQ
jgi:hypothetical protein